MRKNIFIGVCSLIFCIVVAMACVPENNGIEDIDDEKKDVELVWKEGVPDILRYTCMSDNTFLYEFISNKMTVYYYNKELKIAEGKKCSFIVESAKNNTEYFIRFKPDSVGVIFSEIEKNGYSDNFVEKLRDIVGVIEVKWEYNGNSSSFRENYRDIWEIYSSYIVSVLDGECKIEWTVYGHTFSLDELQYIINYLKNNLEEEVIYTFCNDITGNFFNRVYSSLGLSFDLSQEIKVLRDSDKVTMYYRYLGDEQEVEVDFYLLDQVKVTKDVVGLLSVSLPKLGDKDLNAITIFEIVKKDNKLIPVLRGLNGDLCF